MSEPKKRLYLNSEEESSSIDEFFITPEKTLLAAMLERAVADALCATKQCYETRVHAREALAWVKSRRDDAFSFVWVSEALNLDPSILRNYIIRCKKEQIKFYRARGNHMCHEHEMVKGRRIRKVA